MQAILDHLANIVRPAIRDYMAAEGALDAASASKDQAAIDAARHDVIRKARTAAVEPTSCCTTRRPQWRSPTWPRSGRQSDPSACSPGGR
jgi:hypothetical protein